jgi:type II secretory pathway predicted ATPase ExeA
MKAAMDRHELSTKPSETGAHYATSEYNKVRKSMLAALDNGTAFLVDGPPGTQKTYTFRRVVEEINRTERGIAVYLYARHDHAPQSFLVEACTESGIPHRGSIDQLLRKLRFFLGSRKRALLVVDEGQHLPVSTLEVLRQLLDTPPFFGVALGGSHDLSVRLRAWQMEQWRSRLRRAHVLNGLSESEAAEILRGEFGNVNSSFISQSIQDATVEARRNNAPFKYISARNLFFAIEDARTALAEAEANRSKEVVA